MYETLLRSVLAGLVRTGSLTLIDSSGTRHHFGNGSGAAVVMRLADASVARSLLWHPELGLGEGFTDGRIVLEEGSVYDLLELGARNLQGRRRSLPLMLADWRGNLLRRLHQHNPVRRARDNVRHHYDLSDELYALFLDADRQYSCAYFERAGMSLDEAQAAKKRHLAAKLLLRPGQRVLDIGSGWGGLGIYLAQVARVEVTGVTLSTGQHKVSNERAARGGLGERARFLLRDYRQLDGEFDRIVSVGMLEHVGVNHLAAYFARVRDLLKPDGVAVIHSIGRMAGPSATSAWIRKYIFPGGYIPALSEVLPAIERAGLWMTDIEILRLHYAETLRGWQQRFQANRARVRELYDERFCRMWEYYLAASEVFFRVQDGMVFQLQLARRRDAVPLTRGYITDWERSHAKRGELAA